MPNADYPNTNIRVVDSNGNPALCRCGKPAVTFINASANMASSVPSLMESVCDDHDPYKLREMVLVRRDEWERLQALDKAKHD